MRLIELLLAITRNGDNKFMSSRMNKSFFSNHHPHLIVEIENNTSFYSESDINFNKRILLIIDGINSKICCPICKVEIDPMKRGESGKNFRQFCSQKCSGQNNMDKIITRTADKQTQINQKRTNTMMGLYGFAYNSQRPDIKSILESAKYHTHSRIRYDILDDKVRLLDMYRTRTSTEIGEICSCDYSVVLDYLRKYGMEIGSDHTKVSREQRELGEFVVGLGFDIEMNSKVLGNKDIDIFVPSLNVGIEYNGFPWHLDNFTNGKRGSDYHIGKSDTAKSLGIRLIHVFPHNSNIITQSIIRNALGKSELKIAGRKCHISYVGKDETKKFLDYNHLKGNSNFDTGVGLWFNDELVHVLTIGSPRFDTHHTYEIIRSSSRINTSVVGGFSRCLKYFINNNTLPGQSILTYADRSISEGNSYIKAGFSFLRKTQPGYYYVERTKSGFVIHSRYKFQKHKLVHLSGYSIEKTEYQIMIESGYDRYWDCGNNVYVLTI